MASDRNAAVGTARRDALPPNSALNDYEVERVLGSGGFGIVYLARHVELDRPVAIKEYLPTECAVREGLSVHPKGDEYRAAFEEGLSRFRDEARRLVDLDDHPAIVSCRDFFRANGTAYLVMEYAEGEPLSQVLRAREAVGRPFDQTDLLNVITPLLAGLAKVHAAGVIHRDIKPGNIMIRKRDGQPMLLDFGAAKQGVAELSKSMAPFTEGYAAFEQVGDGKLGPWTDIYAVGAVMWRMVAGGNPPWEPPNPLKVESRARGQLRGADDPLPPASALGEGRFSAGVLTAIENCLRLHEAERTQDCGELLRGLRGEPATFDSSRLSAERPVHPGVGSSQRNRVLTVLVPAMGALLLAGVVLTVVLPTDTSDSDQDLNREPIAAPQGPEPTPDPETEDGETDGEVVLGSFSILADPPTSRIEFLNRREAYIAGMALPPGQYRLRISAPGHQSTQLAIKHGPGPTVERISLNSQDVAEGRLNAPAPTPSRNIEDEVQSGVPSQNAEIPGAAQFGRGVKHYSGRGVPQNYKEALEWFREAADYGHPGAQYRLGTMYDTGEGVVLQDYGEAVAWYRKAAVQGHAKAQQSLGEMYRFGLGVPQDDQEAVAWYRRAAEQGDAPAQSNLGFMYGGGRGLPQDDREAVAWFRRAADQGHAEAQGRLGFMYADGRGVPQDDGEAVAWYRKAAEQGDALAQSNLGFMYDEGRGVPQDDEEAVAWYRRAAEQRDARAEFNLGMMYAGGRGVPQDDGEALAWFRRAADQGDPRAQFNLGIMYAMGRGVPEDDEEAMEWYRKAAKQGLVVAQTNLGLMYANGEGALQDDVRAYAWWGIAAAQGDKVATENRKSVGRRMTPEQIDEAERLSLELVPQ